MKTEWTKGQQPELQEIAALASRLSGRGWAEANAGNIALCKETQKDDSLFRSAVAAQPLPLSFPELAGKRFLVTGAGTRMIDVAQSPETNVVFLQLTNDGSAYHLLKTKDDLRPSSELTAHLSLFQDSYKAGHPVKAVLHTHPTELIALTQIKRFCNEAEINYLLWSMYAESVIVNPGGIGFVPYILTGTTELAAASVSALRRHSVALWEKHGCIAAGNNLADLFDQIDVANKAATIYLLCSSAGIEPEGLTSGQMSGLKKKFG